MRRMVECASLVPPCFQPGATIASNAIYRLACRVMICIIQYPNATYSMHYALTPRTFLYSHYFSTGLRIATGVLGLTVLALWATRLEIAMVVCIGALCTSL